jgi:hypothetical protein
VHNFIRWLWSVQFAGEGIASQVTQFTSEEIEIFLLLLTIFAATHKT